MALLKIYLLISLIAIIQAETDKRFFVKKAPSNERKELIYRRPVQAASSVNYKATAQCPEENGFFPDSQQCDKYYKCVNGEAHERLCADGLVFNDYDHNEEKCDLPLNIDCSNRPKLQNPQPSEHCPRKNGYFGHEKPGVCDKFYYCVDGKFNMITCPASLVFNPKTGICTWADEIEIKGCQADDLYDFECPKVNETEGIKHPRYADPSDCQYFFVCVNGDIPRKNGCKFGQVFDDSKKECTHASNVPKCADWYKDQIPEKEVAHVTNKQKSKKH